MKRKFILLLACTLLAASTFAQTWNIGYPNEADVTATLSDGVLTISGEGEMMDYAFLNSTGSLTTKVIIEEGVTSIGQSAFSGCSELISIYIPASITQIGGYAFQGCWKMTEFNVDANNLNYSSEDGILFNKTKSKLYLCPNGKTGNYVIPTSVDSVIGLGFDYSKLSSIYISASVSYINGFFSCRSLTAINVDESNLNYSSENGVLFNKTKSKLIKHPENKAGDYVIPLSTNIIERQAFIDCRNLASIDIPASVTDIRGEAFRNCQQLTFLTIPSNVSNIGNWAFADCNGLDTVQVAWLNLDSFNIIDDEAPVNINIFNNVILSEVTLLVPRGTKSLYEAAPVWQNFKIEEFDSPHYHPTTTSYPYTATFTTSVVLNGTEMQSDRIEIGAFAGSECRGSIVLQNYPEVSAHPYLGFLTVHGNSGENITFKVYNHNAGKEYAATNAPTAFTDNAIYGEPDAPYAITITDTVTQQIPLSAGWSWISTNVSNNAPSLLAQFKQNIGADGVMIKGYNEFIQAPYWVGSLTEINNTSMYMVNTSSASVLPFTGLPADPAAHPVILSSGWDWIGYLPQASLPIDEALAGLNPQEGDQIKSYSEYSSYTVANGWVGSLQTLSPGNGYMYFSANTASQSFLYPSASPENLMTTLRSNEEQITPKWSVANHRFANNMTLTSVVLSDDFELQSGQIEIGAFSGDECRGSVLLKNVSQITEHPYLGFLVVYGENDDDIRLRIYDHTSDKEYEADNKLSFVADAIHGNSKNPVKVVASPLGINSSTASDPIISTQYYNLQGQEITHPQAGQIYIAKELHQSGKTTVRKIVVND